MQSLRERRNENIITRKDIEICLEDFLTCKSCIPCVPTRVEDMRVGKEESDHQGNEEDNLDWPSDIIEIRCSEVAGKCLYEEEDDQGEGNAEHHTVRTTHRFVGRVITTIGPLINRYTSGIPLTEDGYDDTGCE
jgi:hypothetical protein